MLRGNTTVVVDATAKSCFNGVMADSSTSTPDNSPSQVAFTLALVKIEPTSINRSPKLILSLLADIDSVIAPLKDGYTRTVLESCLPSGLLTTTAKV
jgi:hypothetical protein